MEIINRIDAYLNEAQPMFIDGKELVKDRSNFKFKKDFKGAHKGDIGKLIYIASDQIGVLATIDKTVRPFKQIEVYINSEFIDDTVTHLGYFT